MTAPFPPIRFRGQLRPSQTDVVNIARQQLDRGERSLHVVAPPGSGKTVLGLYLWAECIRCPALVLSPNSAIQSQWVDRLELFDLPPGHPSPTSMDPKAPGLFTSLTYQSITLPQRGGEKLDTAAVDAWIEKLVATGQAQDPEEAAVWIEDLRRHNRDYFDERLSAYRKAVRDDQAERGKTLQTLHASSLETLSFLKDSKIGLLILDECHHLLSHWGRVLQEAHGFFSHPIVLGLTATPPDEQNKPGADVTRYRKFFGPIDYEVPVPAVVKEGFLAPYQDLVYFVRPTAEELAYIANADEQLCGLVDELCHQPRESDTDRGEAAVHRCEESLGDWLRRILAERRLAVGCVEDWPTFESRAPALAWAGPRFLSGRGLFIPRGVPQPRTVPAHSGTRNADQSLSLPVMVPVLEHYVRRRLRISADPRDHALAESVTDRLRLLGTQITETGSRACASLIGRVLAYAQGKAAAVLPILKAEHSALGDRIRAVIVTDFEKTSATAAEIRHLLDEEAGGAVAVYRMLLSDADTDELDPILVTGSTVLVDDDLASKFDAAAEMWLARRDLDVELEYGEEDGFHVLSGRGPDWSPRTYVALVTEFFQRGLTKCLVGTRGLLGEGWDADKVNVLIDLTTVTTSTSVNQLRGRSIRLDPEDPDKVAHNWDVVCLAPEFVKGLDDYARFIAKHQTLFGVTDDGVIEKGVGHVHAALTEIEPELVEGSMSLLNEEMLHRPAERKRFRELWRIGEPYHPDPIHALELAPGGGGGGFSPAYANPQVEWTNQSLTEAVARAILGALREAQLIAGTEEFFIDTRAGGYVRAFLKQASVEESRLFSESLAEALGPLEAPRYVIRRFVDYRTETWLSCILPQIFARYFEKQTSRLEMVHAVPIALAKNKSLAAIYAKHWNSHVSPGQAVYARGNEGRELIEQAKSSGLAPEVILHRKEVFL